MNKNWLIAMAVVAALGGAFVLGGATVLAGREFVAARFGNIPFVAGTAGSPAAQEDDANEDKGIVIVDVRADSPAAEAGLQRGDILLAIDDSETNNLADVRAALDEKADNESVTLRISRGGTEQTLTAALDGIEERVVLGIQMCGAGEAEVFGGSIDGFPGEAGARITKVVEGSPAATAGLESGEVIAAVDGEALEHPMALGDVIAAHQPGDTITLTVRGADDAEREVEVILGAAEEDESRAYLGVRYGPGFPFGRMWRGDGGEEWGTLPPFPALPGDTIPPLAEGESYSALVVAEVEAGSAAENAGLTRGDHITEIDGTPVAELIESAQDVSTIFEEYRPGDEVMLTVRRNGESEALSISAALAADDEGNAILGIHAGYVTVTGSENGRFDGLPAPDIFTPAPDLELIAPETQA